MVFPVAFCVSECPQLEAEMEKAEVSSDGQPTQAECPALFRKGSDKQAELVFVAELSINSHLSSPSRTQVCIHRGVSYVAHQKRNLGVRDGK